LARISLAVFKRFIGKGIVRNTSWLLAGQGASIVVQGLYFVCLARLLGATEYGLLVGATALIAIVSQHSSIGAGFVFLRHVSPDLSRFRVYWGYCLTATILGASLVVAAVVFAAHWVLRDINPTTVLYLALGDCLFLQLSAVGARVFQTFEKMHFTALSNLITNSLRLCSAAVLLKLWHHAQVGDWAVISVSISAASSVVVFILVTRVLGWPQWSPSLLRKHSVEGMLFSSSTTTSSIFNDIDKVLLGHYGMNAANGIYSMAYRAVDTGTIVIRSIHNAAFPEFCRRGAIGIEATRTFAQKLLSKTFWISVAISGALFLAAPLLPVFAGRTFESSVAALRWLCILPVLRSFHLSAGDALSGAGFQRYRFLYELAAAAGNLGVNLIVIPLYSWKGAAIVSLATDGALALASWLTVNAIAARAGSKQAVSLNPA
jgi:O-antigen/teichoic acid export membrane protein